jgi:hypothetical protein
MSEDLDRTVRSIADWLGVMVPRSVGTITPRLRRQADHETERLVEEFVRATG